MQNLMESDRATQMLQLTSGSSSSTVQKDAILQWVLGTHQGIMMGVGSTLPRRTVPGASSSVGSQSKCSSSAQLPPEFAHVIPRNDLVPPGPLMNPPTPQADDDVADDDDEAVDLGD
ncbi:hypothetical protein TIFTF001_040413 [Ficus carica]|uniref:Uncharacterized protein n=1 Tax=Ficus carica TaxID=3494 RepID=A0AA87Z309_FICCA|nr:hypothetical protein TIFTF001_040413 [Ficus carica]